MQTTHHAAAPKISRQLFVSVGASYLWKIPLKQESGSRSRSVSTPAAWLDGRRGHASPLAVTRRARPVTSQSPYERRLIGSVHTPAERIQSHCAAPRLHFSELTDLYKWPAAQSNMKPNLPSATTHKHTHTQWLCFGCNKCWMPSQMLPLYQDTKFTIQRFEGPLLSNKHSLANWTPVSLALSVSSGFTL